MQALSGALRDVEFKDIAMVHLGRLLHRSQRIHDLFRVGSQAGDRLSRAQWEVVPRSFVKQNAVSRRKHKAAHAIKVGQLDSFRTWRSQDHRKRSRAQTNEQLRHPRVPFQPGDLTASLVDAGRANDCSSMTIERNVVTLFDGAFVKRNRQSAVGNVVADEESELCNQLGSGRNDRNVDHRKGRACRLICYLCLDLLQGIVSLGLLVKWKRSLSTHSAWTSQAPSLCCRHA